MIADSKKVSIFLDSLIILAAAVVFLAWTSGNVLLYQDDGPVMSPFTAAALLLMTVARLATNCLTTWSRPMTLALLGIVACGNISSMWIQLSIPELFLQSDRMLIATSTMTSIGLVFFCFYEILCCLRKTSRSAYIIDDILLHLALFPGALSFLGHMLDINVYRMSTVDPRVGISPLEMVFMATYAVSAVINNKDLFLWHFLRKSVANRLTFALLFINQYVTPIGVGFFLRPQSLSKDQVGLELYVMIAGVLTTLLFLIIQATLAYRENEEVI